MHIRRSQTALLAFAGLAAARASAPSYNNTAFSLFKQTDAPTKSTRSLSAPGFSVSAIFLPFYPISNYGFRSPIPSQTVSDTHGLATITDTNTSDYSPSPLPPMFQLLITGLYMWTGLSVSELCDKTLVYTRSEHSLANAATLMDSANVLQDTRG
jgi:hypothetical protein